VTAAQESTSETAGNEQPESALLVAARQLSEEAWLRPDVAGLSIARQRAVAIRRSIRAQHLAKAFGKDWAGVDRTAVLEVDRLTHGLAQGRLRADGLRPSSRSPAICATPPTRLIRKALRPGVCLSRGPFRDWWS